MRFPRRYEAPALGLLGVVAFSLTLPATRVAVPALGDITTGLGRSLLAALVAGAVLALRREPLPARRYWGRLALTASGVVLGFPLLISIALAHLTSAHSAVIVGLLPASTAVMSVVRAGERPSVGFWLAALFGLVAVLAFAAVQGAGAPQPADIIVLAAVLMGALGYAEGGALAREIDGWRVISWVLVLSAPVVAPIVLIAMLHDPPHPTVHAWIGFGYAALISAYGGFLPWYRALALGGVARIGQIQLAQPILTLGWSALLLGERVDGTTIIASLVVLASVALSQRMRVRHVRDERLPAPGDVMAGDSVQRPYT
jgi:drug/metabolite transporter (DMT)-like permease